MTKWTQKICSTSEKRYYIISGCQSLDRMSEWGCSKRWNTTEERKTKILSRNKEMWLNMWTIKIKVFLFYTDLGKAPLKCNSSTYSFFGYIQTRISSWWLILFNELNIEIPIKWKVTPIRNLISDANSRMLERSLHPLISMLLEKITWFRSRSTPT